MDLVERPAVKTPRPSERDLAAMADEVLGTAILVGHPMVAEDAEHFRCRDGILSSVSSPAHQPRCARAVKGCAFLSNSRYVVRAMRLDVAAFRANAEVSAEKGVRSSP